MKVTSPVIYCLLFTIHRTTFGRYQKPKKKYTFRFSDNKKIFYNHKQHLLKNIKNFCTCYHDQLNYADYINNKLNYADYIINKLNCILLLCNTSTCIGSIVTIFKVTNGQKTWR